MKDLISLPLSDYSHLTVSIYLFSQTVCDSAIFLFSFDYFKMISECIRWWWNFVLLTSTS